MKVKNDFEKNLIGALAVDIRHYWGDNVDSRLDLMITLCRKIDRNDLAEWLDYNRNNIYNDGRYLRDEFELYGKYTEDFVNSKEFEKYKDYFECLESI